MIRKCQDHPCLCGVTLTFSKRKDNALCPNHFVVQLKITKNVQSLQPLCDCNGCGTRVACMYGVCLSQHHSPSLPSLVMCSLSTYIRLHTPTHPRSCSVLSIHPLTRAHPRSPAPPCARNMRAYI